MPAGKLVVANIAKSYPGAEGVTTVIRDVSLTALPGDTVAIIGPSGAGKSTLLNIIGSLDTPTGGTVMLDELAVTGLQGRELALFRATRVGFVFQDHHLLPQLTARENILLPTLAGHTKAGGEKTQELLESVGVAHRADAYPAQLSGGERQRVAIARALINGAKLLLCDEPTGNLDHDTGATIITLFLELAKQGVTIIMVTHNAEHAARFARCLELRDGELKQIGGAA
ncbi:MAG: ABC transporter ATP-binding protein [bacterium]